MKKLLILLMALFMLVGCSGSKTDDKPTGGDVPTSNSIGMQVETDIQSMDLNLATDGTSFEAITMCFAGLIELGPNNEIIKDLAESYEVSEDGLLYTFHLVDSKWSNGEPVKAQDFVFSWRRLADPATASDYSFLLDTVHIKNAAAVVSGELPLEELGVVAVDDKTLEVELEIPCDFFLSVLAFPSLFPLNEEFVTSKGDQYATTVDNMIYCGPYVMETWIPGNSYTFVKNDQYFNVDAYKTDNFVFKFIQDTQAAMLEYDSGNLDIVKLTGELVEVYDGDEGLTSSLGGYLWYLAPYMENPKFANDNFRKAISYGIDRETIANSVLKDGSIAAEGIVPRQLAVHNGVDFRDANGSQMTYDPTLAAQYYEAAKAELGGDVTIDLLFEDTESSKAVAEFIQFNLETNCPGLEVTLNSKPKKTRLELMQNEDFEIALHRWGPDYQDAQTYLELFLTGAGNNYPHYSSVVYDTLMEEATKGAKAADSDARFENFLQAEKELVAVDFAIMPVYQTGQTYMIHPGVTGVQFHTAGVNNFRHIER